MSTATNSNARTNFDPPKSRLNLSSGMKPPTREPRLGATDHRLSPLDHSVTGLAAEYVQRADLVAGPTFQVGHFFAAKTPVFYPNLAVYPLVADFRPTKEVGRLAVALTRG